MPFKVSKPCAFKNCNQIAQAGEAYCPEHTRIIEMKLNKPRMKRRYENMKNNYVEEVTIDYLLDRDNNICQICGQYVSCRYEYPNPLSASIDHIIPVSKGGKHSKDNCRLAHLQCNSIKGDRGV